MLWIYRNTVIDRQIEKSQIQVPRSNWIARQLAIAAESTKNWSEWMQREAGIYPHPLKISMENKSENRVYEFEYAWMMQGHPGHTLSIPKRWTFNGDFVKPTFTPSIKEINGHHYSVQDGIVHYYSDQKLPCCDDQEEFYIIPPWTR